MLDLAAFQPGVVQRIELPAEGMAEIGLRGFAPSAPYRISMRSRQSGSARTHDAERLENRLDKARRYDDTCAIELLTALMATREEAEAVRLLQAPNPADCTTSSRVVSTKKELSRPDAFTLGVLEPGETYTVLVERLGVDGSPERVWRLEILAKQPQRLWQQPNEPTWLVDEIVCDLAEMSWYATHRGLPPEGLRVVAVLAQPAVSARATVDWPGRAHAIEATLDLARGVWTPEAYTVLAREMLGGRGSQIGHERSAELPGVLTDPRGEEIQAANRSVSAALKNEPRSAPNHARAALTIVALGLRETGGVFEDARRLRCRATAHLAMALALGNERSSVASTLAAKAGLLALSRRQRESEEALKALERLPLAKDEMAWIRALHLRNTGDWRSLAQPLTATALERREYLLALRTRVSVQRALDFYDSRNMERIPDWGHVLLQGRGSVEVGNRFASPQLSLELEEASRVLGVPSAQVIGSLAAQPGRCVRRTADGAVAVEVVDAGAWGQYYQRRIAEAIVGQERHLRQLLGLPDEARAFWDKSRDLLRETDIWPFLVGHNRKTGGSGLFGPQARVVEDRVREFWDRRPEAILPQRWQELDGPMPKGDAWFRPDLVAKTTFFDLERSRSSTGSLDCPGQRHLYEMAPFDVRIVSEYLRARYGPQSPAESIPCEEAPKKASPGPGHQSMAELATRFLEFKPTAEAFERFYGSLMAYDLGVMQAHVGYLENRPEEFLQEYRRIAGLDPERWLDLGLELLRRGDERSAADAYQKAVDEARDRVAVANQGYWLVDYYLDHGDREHAMVVARDAASTGAATGMQTLARALERTGDWAAAEAVWHEHDERYPQQPGLPWFRARRSMQAGSESGAAAASRALAGFPAATLRDFSGPPQRGVAIFGNAPFLEACGLGNGDVIVAIDGLKAERLQDYLVLRGLRPGGTAKVIAWHRDRYVEVEGPFRRPHPAVSFKQVGAGGVVR